MDAKNYIFGKFSLTDMLYYIMPFIIQMYSLSNVLII